jgi:hypothetical protein
LYLITIMVVVERETKVGMHSKILGNVVLRGKKKKK